MRHWLVVSLLATQWWLLVGLWRDSGLPPIDAAVAACLYLAFFAPQRAVPMLLVLLAIGRALVDEAALPVHVLVLGVPTAVLLPLRRIFHARRWFVLTLAAAAVAVAVPRLALLLGRVFDQPSVGAQLEPAVLFWSALLSPPLVLLASRLPPLAAPTEAP